MMSTALANLGTRIMVIFLLKLGISLVSLFASGTMTGMYISRHLPLPQAVTNGHLNLAQGPAKDISVAPQDFSGGNTSSAVIAVHTEKIDQLSRENQVSIDDRRLLHDEIARSNERETLQFNTLVNRLDVDEATTSTTLKIGGIIFGLLQVVPVIFTILDYRRRVYGVGPKTSPAS